MSIFEYFELRLAVCVTSKASISCYYVVLPFSKLSTFRSRNVTSKASISCYYVVLPFSKLSTFRSRNRCVDRCVVEQQSGCGSMMRAG